MPEAPGKTSIPDTHDPESQGPNSENQGPDTGNVPRHPEIPDDTSGYVRPSWLRNGTEDDDAPVSRKRGILNRLGGAAREKAANPLSERPPQSPAERRAQIAARIREGKQGNGDLSAPDPWAVLRRQLFPGQKQEASAFDPLASIPVTITGPAPESYCIPDLRVLAQDPLPCADHSPVEDLLRLSEELRDELEAAVARDPIALTVSSVRTFLTDAASLDLELDLAMVRYMEEYAPAAKAVITKYLGHKNTLEGLVAKGTREAEALSPEEFEIHAAYDNLLSDLRRQLRDVKKAFVDFIFKVLAVVSTHKVLHQILASRAEESKTLLKMLSQKLSANARFADFTDRYDDATATTAVLTPGTRDARPDSLDAFPEGLLAIHRVINNSDMPAILADAVTDNGLSTDSGGFTDPSHIYLDSQAVMGLKAVHLQAMRHEGYDLEAWAQLISKSGDLGSELGLIKRLALEALAPHLAPVAREPKHSTSHPAPPNPPVDSASEPRQ